MGFEPRTRDRQDLADFLRTRRERLQPSDVGLPQGPRRRAPGLRREEVAQLAGIGAAWYTWLEQGRGVQPSDNALDGIARAMRMNAAERAHLFQLARGRAAVPRSLLRDDPVTPGLRQVLAALDPCPAYVRTARWDIVAWNKAAARFFGDYAALPPSERNVLLLTFADPSYRSLLADWSGDARQLIAAFRADHAAAPDQSDFAALLSALEMLSPEFKRWWRQHEVVGCGTGVRAYNHPIIGPIDLQYTAFTVADDTILKLVTHTPLPGSNGTKLLSRLTTDGVGADPITPQAAGHAWRGALTS